MLQVFDYLLLTLIKIAFFIIEKLPPKFQIKVLTSIVNIILLFFPRSKYVTFRNLSLCLPHLTKTDKEKIWRSSKIVLAKNLLGYIYIPKLTKERAKKHLHINESIEVAEALKSNTGKGILFLVPHFGSFELLANYWCLLDKPFMILARGFGMKHLDTWWNKKRQIHGNIIFSRKGGFNDIVHYLNSGKNVGILFDQNVKRKHSIFVNFFGIPASTTKTIGLASIKTECKIIFTTMVPKDPNDIEDYKNYELIARWITPPHERSGDDINKKIHDTISEAHAHLEECIRKYPEYWFWIHRRFKTRPEGEAENLYNPELFKEDIK